MAYGSFSSPTLPNLAMGVRASYPSLSTQSPTLPPNQVATSAVNTGQNYMNALGGFIGRALSSIQKGASTAGAPFTATPAATQPVNATSVTTGKPTAGSINGTATPVSSTPTATATPAASTTSTATPAASTTPGTMTQAQLDAQNAALGRTQFNTAPGAVGTSAASDATAVSPTRIGAPITDTSATTPGYNAGQDMSYKGLLQQLAQRSNQASPEYQQAMQAYQEALKAYNTKQQQEATALANNAGIVQPMGFTQGQQQILANQYGQQLQGLGGLVTGTSNALSAANTNQGLLQEALKAAAGGMSPITLQGGQYLAAPTGEEIGGGMTGGIANATKWAIAQQNMAQGQDYQGQAQNLSNAIQTMAPLGQKLTDFIAATGQNPATSPLVNEQIGKVNAQLYPQQAATLNAAVNDIRSYAIQILGSQSGANPTDVTSAVNSFDFSKFSAVDLANFLKDLNNMGNTRLAQTQSAMSASYGANTAGGGAPAAGVTAKDQGAFTTGGMTPSSMSSNIGKALVGSLANAAGSAASAAGNILGGAAGGEIAGAAVNILK